MPETSARTRLLTAGLAPAMTLTADRATEKDRIVGT
jgi:hypothetical protein